MNIKLRLYGSLHRYGKKDGWFEQEILENTSIKDLLLALNLPISSVFFITVNGRQESLEYVPKGGEEIRVFPQITGG
ncbi:MAG TPA: MoaD/ThiS family protein [Firmicutes bacterium]|nr:MoaD/ThiS family protein [Bacillota bacterium]